MQTIQPLFSLLFPSITNQSLQQTAPPWACFCQSAPPVKGEVFLPTVAKCCLLGIIWLLCFLLQHCRVLTLSVHLSNCIWATENRWLYKKHLWIMQNFWEWRVWAWSSIHSIADLFLWTTKIVIVQKHKHLTVNLRNSQHHYAFLNWRTPPRRKMLTMIQWKLWKTIINIFGILTFEDFYHINTEGTRITANNCFSVLSFFCFLFANIVLLPLRLLFELLLSDTESSSTAAGVSINTVILIPGHVIQADCRIYWPILFQFLCSPLQVILSPSALVTKESPCSIYF